MQTTAPADLATLTELAAHHAHVAFLAGDVAAHTCLPDDLRQRIERTFDDAVASAAQAIQGVAAITGEDPDAIAVRAVEAASRRRDDGVPPTEQARPA